MGRKPVRRFGWLPNVFIIMHICIAHINRQVLPILKHLEPLILMIFKFFFTQNLMDRKYKGKAYLIWKEK